MRAAAIGVEEEAAEIGVAAAATGAVAEVVVEAIGEPSRNTRPRRLNNEARMTRCHSGFVYLL